MDKINKKKLALLTGIFISCPFLIAYLVAYTEANALTGTAFGVLLLLWLLSIGPVVFEGLDMFYDWMHE